MNQDELAALFRKLGARDPDLGALSSSGRHSAAHPILPATERGRRDEGEDGGIGSCVKPGVGDAGDVCSRSGPGVHPAVLEEEVTELLGRGKSARREPGAETTYRIGHGKPRRLALTSGTITLRRPRVRGLSERFESRLMPLFKRRTAELGSLLPELYLHGLAEGDFELALRGLLGEGAPLSASSIARLKAGWQVKYETWRTRSLAALEVVYLWADGLYVKAGIDDGKAALLVVIGALSDGRKVVLAVESGQRESTASWAAVLRDLKARGRVAPRLTIADGHLGIWGALAEIYPESAE